MMRIALCNEVIAPMSFPRQCEYAGKLESPVGFASCDDAERAGKIACDFCKPRESGR